MTAFRHFQKIWFVDFEFQTIPRGNPVVPICIGVRELHTGECWQRWHDEFTKPLIPGFNTERDLYVAYFASAEMECHLVLGDQIPKHICCLHAEHRVLTNGKSFRGNRLQDALDVWGVTGTWTVDKGNMQRLLAHGGPFTEQQKQDALRYVGEDVEQTEKLFLAMAPRITNLSHTLMRGQYTASVARMILAGIPIDVETLQRIQDNDQRLKSRVVVRIDKDFGIFRPSTHKSLKGKKYDNLMAEAERLGVSPHVLAAIVDELWDHEYSTRKEYGEAVQAARKATGLTPRKIDKIENSGRDHSSVKHLDVLARELAAEYPILGLPSYEYDDPSQDGAELLFDLLANPRESLEKYGSDVCEHAASLLHEGEFDLEAIPWSFSSHDFEQWLRRTGRLATWPRTDKGRLATDDETFRAIEKRDPGVAPLRQVLGMLGELKLCGGLTVGRDGRNRCLLSQFASITGRNQPSSSRFIFGGAAWVRYLIQPPPGKVLLYCDWSGQEFAIMAYRSGDRRMVEDYEAGDCYLNFGKRIQVVPAAATKSSHREIRAALKVSAGLGAAYGAGPHTVAAVAGISVRVASRWLRQHRFVYPDYWRWSDDLVAQGQLRRKLVTCFGWTAHAPFLNGSGDSKTRTLRNFGCQATGAEMLRCAIVMLHQAGVTVNCPVHDAVLIECNANRVEEVKAETLRIMALASEKVLGRAIRCDADVIVDRFEDEDRGGATWRAVADILNELEGVPF